MKAACFSVAALDYFPDKGVYGAGGNALNQAVRFASLGLRSAFVGPLGTDEAGKRILGLFKKAGVDTSHTKVISGATASNQIVHDAQGERYGVAGAWQGGVYETFALQTADWHFLKRFDIWATHANGVNYLPALREKSESQFVAVDFLEKPAYRLLEETLSKIDIAYFGGSPDMLEPLADIARRHSGVVVLTLGAQGSVAIQGRRRWHQQALALEQVVDTTGCGDAFQAGFSASFAEYGNVEDALYQGAMQGRSAAMHLGGVPW